MFWRQAVVIEHTAKQPISRKTANLLIQSISERDQALLEGLTREWDKGRPADSLAKSEPLFGFQLKDQLLFQWSRATSYSALLATHPDYFYQLLINKGTK